MRSDRGSGRMACGSGSVAEHRSARRNPVPVATRCGAAAGQVPGAERRRPIPRPAVGAKGSQTETVDGRDEEELTQAEEKKPLEDRQRSRGGQASWTGRGFERCDGDAGLSGCRVAAPHCGRESEREGDEKGEGEWLDAKLTKPASREQHQPTATRARLDTARLLAQTDSAVQHGAPSHRAPPDMQPPRGERHKTGRHLLGATGARADAMGSLQRSELWRPPLGMINSRPSNFLADTLCQRLGIKAAGDFPASMHGISEVQVRSWSRASVLPPPFNVKIPSAHAR